MVDGKEDEQAGRGRESSLVPVSRRLMLFEHWLAEVKRAGSSGSRSSPKRPPQSDLGATTDRPSGAGCCHYPATTVATDATIGSAAGGPRGGFRAPWVGGGPGDSAAAATNIFVSKTYGFSIKPLVYIRKMQFQLKHILFFKEIICF